MISGVLVPLNDPRRSYLELREAIDQAVAEVLASGRWLEGPCTARFAEEFAHWCGVDHCIPVANGTDALELALRAVGVGPGAEVVTVANAGGYTTTACRLVGATPVWVDVRQDTLGLDVEQVVAAVGERTAAVVVTHLYGLVADVQTLRAELDRCSTRVPIIEDCAQAHGAKVGGVRVGSHGDIATFSFYPTKNLGALGDAGALVTADAAIATRLAQLRQYGWELRYRSRVPWGRNSRMDELQAAVLSVKLPHVDRWTERRRAVIDRYQRGLRSPAHLVAGGNQTSETATSAAHLAVIRVPRRDQVRTALATKGIGVEVHYPVLDCDQPSQNGLPGRRLQLAESERALGEILTLPCFPQLRDEEIDLVVDAVNEAVERFA